MKLRYLLPLLLAVVLTACVTSPPSPPSTVETPVYDISKVDRIPVARKRTAPHYPSSLRKANVEGEAVVDFIVDVQGNTTHVFSPRYTHEAFGVAACEAVSQWVFRPAKKNGQFVPCHLQVPIFFRLNEDE